MGHRIGIWVAVTMARPRFARIFWLIHYFFLLRYGRREAQKSILMEIFFFLPFSMLVVALVHQRRSPFGNWSSLRLPSSLFFGQGYRLGFRDRLKFSLWSWSFVRIDVERGELFDRCLFRPITCANMDRLSWSISSVWSLMKKKRIWVVCACEMRFGLLGRLGTRITCVEPVLAYTPRDAFWLAVLLM